MRAMCGLQLKGQKGSTDLMFMLEVNETTDQLTMPNIVHWYGHELRRDEVTA